MTAIYVEPEDTPADKAYRSAKGRCLCPLQNLPYAKRALVFLEPFENWGLFFVRTETELSVFSTRHQEDTRSRSDSNMSLNHLEYVGEEKTLQEALSLFADGLPQPIEIDPREAIGMLVTEIEIMAIKSVEDYHCDQAKKDEIARKLMAYIEDLLSEHIGIDLGVEIHSCVQDGHIAVARDIVERRSSQDIILKPISGKSPHARWAENYIDHVIG